MSLTPPFRYSKVNPELSRGSYPTLINYEFMKRLKLRYLLLLSPEPPINDLIDFTSNYNINITHIQILQNQPLDKSLQTNLLQALQIIINKDNFPLYVCCLDGRRTIGLLVAILRRLQGWSILSTMTEYWSYALSDRPSLLVQDIEKQTKDIEKFVNDITIDFIIPIKIPNWLWNGDRTANVSCLKLKYDPNSQNISDIAETT